MWGVSSLIFPRGKSLPCHLLPRIALTAHPCAASLLVFDPFPMETQNCSCDLQTLEGFRPRAGLGHQQIQHPHVLIEQLQRARLTDFPPVLLPIEPDVADDLLDPGEPQVDLREDAGAGLVVPSLPICVRQ